MAVCEVAGYLRELEHTVSHIDPVHPKHAQELGRAVCFFRFQELCSDLCNMGLCSIMLKDEVMAGNEWQHNGPQDLLILSLCI
jgi:hypothetical protein